MLSDFGMEDATHRRPMMKDHLISDMRIMRLGKLHFLHASNAFKPPMSFSTAVLVVLK
jgi:hypothetical protein